MVTGHHYDCIVSVIAGLQGIPNNTYLMIGESHTGEVSLDKIKPPLIRPIAIVLLILIHAALVASIEQITKRPTFCNIRKIG